jgi:translation initiation factor 3 subunit L
MESNSPKCHGGKTHNAHHEPTLSRLFSSREEGIAAFEELFIHACPKFVSANPPPYDDPSALLVYIEEPIVEPLQRHLRNFLSDVRTQAPVPTLRSFLKLYASLDTSKLAGFLDADEEEMVQQMMIMKQASRSISRVGSEKGHLDGQTITTSDLDFVINEV